MPVFDVIVIGGGHAGCEAAYAAARTGVNTALVTLKFAGIGQMSCNPAIGGLGKGHLVREIDAMGGIMGITADQAGIQFRLLNRSKGPAVRGPRAQMDRSLYSSFMQKSIMETPNLEVVIGEVVDFEIANGAISGVILADDTKIKTRAVVLTTGTFLRGIIRLGEKAIPAGRAGDPAAVRLAKRLEELELPLGRLKTGTPPRLDRKTIQWDKLIEQPGDENPVLFSFVSQVPTAKQISCAITHTNKKTHEIIDNNLTKSAIYGGHFDSVGPRYCPSIEDKIVRFPERTSHQIFLEPEGLSTDVVYPNGISTSLPEKTQTEFVRSINGLENAEITQFGYAIEYDFVDPRSLNETLQTRALTGLFLAGQINGTTGYEEAAGQGLVAGLNAAQLANNQEPVRFSRSESYIGVMVDDLITKGVTEPYRMFTSRAEFRLTLRADNADQRLTPRAMELGIISEVRIRSFQEKIAKLSAAKILLKERKIYPMEAKEFGITLSMDGVPRTALDLLSYPEITMESLIQIWPKLRQIEPSIAEQIQSETVYSRYLDRQEKEANLIRSDEKCRIPSNVNYSNMQGLSGELRTKLNKIKPETLGQAGRIEGMTPSALAYILSTVQR